MLALDRDRFLRVIGVLVAILAVAVIAAMVLLPDRLADFAEMLIGTLTSQGR